MSKIKKLIAVGIIALALIIARPHGPSNKEIMSKVVQLQGNGSLCSGEQVRAPSGVDYILSAAHCAHLATDGSIEVKTEDGRKMKRRVIAEDPMSDLLLIEGLPNLKGLDIAESVHRGQAVRTFTHGRGFATYETTGVIIEDKRIAVSVFDIMDDKALAKCKSMPKYVVDQGWFGMSCMLNVSETATTALVAPGSSGGMVLDASGKLIGVVSAGDSTFGYLVTLDHIKSFLANY